MVCSSFAMRMILTFAFMWLLAGTGLSYWGRNEFQEGAHKVYTLTTDLQIVFKELNQKAISIEDNAATSQEYATAPGVCNGTAADALIAGTGAFKAAAEMPVQLLDGLAPLLGMVGKLFEERIPVFIDWGIGLVTAFMGLTVFFGLWSITCGSTARRKSMIAFSAVVLALMCPLIAFELTLSVVLSDFCVSLEDGDSSLLVMANDYGPKAAYPLVSFYITCNGTNPLAEEIDATADTIALLNGTTVALEQGRVCRDSSLFEIQDASLDSSNTIRSMSENIGCSVINPLVAGIFHNVICGSVVPGIYKIWAVQLSCAVSLWVLLFFVQAEILTRETEGRLELAKQEQRLGLVPSSFLPRKGTAKRRLHDKKKRKELLAEDKKLAEELAATNEERARDEVAWALADQEAVAEAAAEEKRKWLVKNPRGFGTGEERREETLRLGPGGAAAAAAAAKEKAAKARQRKKRLAAKRTFDPDAERTDGDGKKGS